MPKSRRKNALPKQPIPIPYYDDGESPVASPKANAYDPYEADNTQNTARSGPDSSQPLRGRQHKFVTPEIAQVGASGYNYDYMPFEVPQWNPNWFSAEETGFERPSGEDDPELENEYDSDGPRRQYGRR